MTPSDGNPMDSSMDSRSNVTHNLVATEAADLIRQLDAAFGDMNASILAGAMEAEEARKNARVAAELARRFSRGNPSVGGGVDLISWSADGGSRTSPAQKSPRLSSSEKTASSPQVHNGWSPMSHTGFRRSPLANNNTAAKSRHAATDGYASTSNDNSHDMPSSNSQRTSTKIAERLAATHAEELLQVSLELERTKRQLEAEQMRHDETKSALQQVKQKNAVAEEHLERLLQDMETAREENGRRIDILEDDLQRAHERIQTAEMEAATAMDICVQADQAKETSDQSLQRALAQINALKEYIAQYHTADDYLRKSSTENEEDSSERRRRVRFQVDEDAALPTTSMEWDALQTSSSSSSVANDRPSRALVAMGRQILQRSFSNDPDTPFVSQTAMEASIERRQRLRNRLEALGVEGNDNQDNAFAPATTRPSREGRQLLSSAVDALSICRNVAQVVKESGRRLNLSGRWFVEGQGATSSVADEIHLETLVKHYATMVEVR
jgi:hypothetical protein